MSAVPASFRLLQMRYQGVVDRCQHAHAPACPFMGVERWRVQPTFLNHARPLRHARSNGVTQMLCGQTVITRAIGAAATTTTTAISVVAAAADRMDQKLHPHFLDCLVQRYLCHPCCRPPHLQPAAQQRGLRQQQQPPAVGCQKDQAGFPSALRSHEGRGEGCTTTSEASRGQ